MSLKIKSAILCFMLAMAVFRGGYLSANEISPRSSYKLEISTPSKLWIEGDSTFHRYDARASVVDLAAAGALSAFSPDMDSRETLKGVVVAPNFSGFVLRVSVVGLQSGIPGLAGKIHGTLKHKKFPEIIFTMSDYKAVPSPDKEGVYSVTALGTLDIAGSLKETSLEFEAEPSSDGLLRVRGEKHILMTDFGVKPPAVVFIKAADKVEVKWDITLKVVNQ